MTVDRRLRSYIPSSGIQQAMSGFCSTNGEARTEKGVRLGVQNVSDGVDGIS